MRAPTNKRWGFESTCFVCERRNDSGLRIPLDLVELEARFVGPT